jgi:protein O-mannosyl-transferase
MSSPSTTEIEEPEATAALPAWPFSSSRAATLVVSLLLVLATLFLYQHSLRNGFTNYDDPIYVTRNPHVREGLSWNNVVWAFHSNVAGHWHPLTVISQMTDVQIFGLNPRGHHLDSVLLHALNVLLLFLLLRCATGYIGRSAMVAGLFALSPLNVEAVDWVADRKAVLCTTFLLLALFAYGWYVRRPSMGRYLMLIFLFACGLMSEAMVITLPAALLLADYWPLDRYGFETTLDPGVRARRVLKLIVEKIPLLILSAGSAFMTMRAARSGGAATPFSLFPLSLRVKNAIYSYAVYIFKAFWPTHLAVIYPHPGRSLALWKVIAAAVLVSVITAVVWRRRERRYLVVGWLWFLGTLVPVIGIFQAGLQGMADRYTYIPFMGLFVMAVWLFADTAARIDLPQFVAATTAFAVLLAYACVSYVQIGYWRDSYALFTHAEQVTTRNPVAESSLGIVFENSGQIDQAIRHYESAVEFMPQWSTPHFRLGLMYQMKNRLDDAIRQYNLALAFETDPAEAWEAYNNLGLVLAQLNRPREAIAQFTAAVNINPNDPVTLTNRGLVEYRERKLAAARDDLARAAQLEPTAERYFWLGRALEDSGSISAAVDAYEAALRLAPNSADARTRLDLIHQKLQKRP